MSEHPLDRPIWSALSEGWAPHAEGGSLARRLRRNLGLFGGAADRTKAALDALGALVPEDGGELWIVERDPPEPPGARTVREARCVQMVLGDVEVAPVPQLPVSTLGAADAPAMLALADLTRPGPYLLDTYRLGHFIGVRDGDGRLIAMAGERMRMAGHAEVSAVCTHPDAQRRGLGSALMRLVMAQMIARGERPFLHAYTTNAGAIGLYERLGFRTRAEMGVRIVVRD